MAQDSSRPEFWDSRYRDHVTPWDKGGSPARLIDFARTLPSATRVLIPGCGTGHEAVFLARAGLDVLALDFSAAAVKAARETAGPFADLIVQADFFDFDAGTCFYVIYERAFLCALPRHLWPAYAARAAEVLRPGGCIAGFWFFDDNDRGPPFGTSDHGLEALLGPAFRQECDEAVTDSLPIFEGRERWQVWRLNTAAASPLT